MAIARTGRAGTLYAAVGRELKERRKAQGLGQEELAMRISLSRSSIANAEAGRQAIPLHHLVEIAEALGTTASEVMQAAEARRAQSVSEPPAALPKSVLAFLQREAGGTTR